MLIALYMMANNSVSVTEARKKRLMRKAIFAEMFVADPMKKGNKIRGSIVDKVVNAILTW